MPSFEQQMAELETIVDSLERGDLPLEESVRLYEQGMRLTNSCRKELDTAEGRLQVLQERPDGSREAVDLVLNNAADPARDRRDG